MNVIFIDCESTGLEPGRHEPWEVAIVEEDGTEHVWCWRPRSSVVEAADDLALEIGGFHNRAPADRSVDDEMSAVDAVAALTEDSILVGSNPSFDAGMLAPWLRGWGYEPAWHYRTGCVATMAYGWLHGRHDALDVDYNLPLPWRSDDLSRACGVEPPIGDERHTALGDALWVARLYRHLTGGAA